MKSYRLFALPSLPLGALLALFALASPSAQAKILHKYEPPPIVEVPAGAGVENPGGLEEVSAMTVDAGSLWVAEHADRSPGHTSEECGEQACAYRVDEFDDATGVFERQLAMSSAPSTAGSILTTPDYGVAVGHVGGGEQVYVGAAQEVGSSRKAGVVSVFDGGSGDFVETWTGAGTPAGSFGERASVLDETQNAVSGVAVDGSPSGGSDWAAGDLLVADTVQGVVDVFKPQAGGGEHYVAQITGPSPVEHFVDPVRVAVSAFNGDVLVLDRTSKTTENIDIFKPAGLGSYEFVTQLVPPGRAPELAVDGGNGEIYVAAVSEYLDAASDENVSTPTVYEYSAAGALIGSFTGKETPEGTFAPEKGGRLDSIAVDPVSHRVFVGDRGHPNLDSGEGLVDVFGPDVLVPDVVSEPVSNVRLVGEEGLWSARFNGTVNTAGAGEATCWFVWGVSESFGESNADCSSSVKSGEASVRGIVSGLLPGTMYYYRLQASNANGVNEGEASEDQSFMTPGPNFAGEFVSRVSSSSVTLHADVDPLGHPVSDYFQYSTGSTGGCGQGAGVCAVAPSVPMFLGDGSGAVEVPEQHLDGLRPDTVYHYRVVVESEYEAGKHATFDGPDKTFVTEPVGAGSRLLDGRAWQLVSPADMGGAVIKSLGRGAGVVQAAADGSAITYVTSLPVSEAGGYYENVQVISTVDAAGVWSTRTIALPHSGAVGLVNGKGGEYRFFSEDLGLGVIQPFGPFTPMPSETFPVASERTPLLRHNDSCVSSPRECYTPLLTAEEGYADVPAGTQFGEEADEPQDKAVESVGTSPDARHVILKATAPLVSGAPGGALYEWSADAEPTRRLVPVSVLPESEGGRTVEEAELGVEKSVFRGFQSLRHAVSTGGERVYWTAEGRAIEKAGGSKESSDATGLYLSYGLGGQTQTLRLDVLEDGSPASSGTALFQAASADGGRVFFTDTQPLLKGSSATGADLYECVIVEEEVAGRVLDKCVLSDITPEPAGGRPAEVVGEILGASEDDDTVYFVANGVYGTAPERGDCPTQSDDVFDAQQHCNVYVWHAGEREPVYIATLSGEDAPDWGFATYEGQNVARVSPDGRWLAFMSSRSLTGYDNEDASSRSPGERMDEEVYLYGEGEGEGAGRLVCASCDPTGARPTGVEYDQAAENGRISLALGQEVWPGRVWLAANIPGWTDFDGDNAQYQSRYLSDEGRLFFNSSDALVPQDENHNEDVYEYEPMGVGGGEGCTEANATFHAGIGGCVGLVSSGTAAGESAFMDASENGDDVFFLTSEKLVPEATGTGVELYDARVCTGAEPCVSSSPAAVACETTESCRGAPLAQPSGFGAPASATFDGEGNLPASSSTGSSGGGKPETRAEKLAKALRACKRDRVKGRRQACEVSARRKYGGAKARAKSKAKAKPGSRRSAKKGSR